MFSTTFKRPFVTAAVVAGLLIAAAPASAGSHQAATDGTSDSAHTSGFVVDGPLTVKPASGFSWSETQTGSASSAGGQGGGAEASGFLVDGPFSVKPARGLG